MPLTGNPLFCGQGSDKIAAADVYAHSSSRILTAAESILP